MKFLCGAQEVMRIVVNKIDPDSSVGLRRMLKTAYGDVVSGWMNVWCTLEVVCCAML